MSNFGKIKRAPVIVFYHKLGFLISQDCWEGNIHLHKDQNPSAYIFDISEMSVAGKISGNKLTTLSMEERKNVIERGWLYKYNPRPIIYWLEEKKDKDLYEKSLKELVQLAKQLSSQKVLNFIKNEITEERGEERGEEKNKDFYIRLLKSEQHKEIFYPICNENRSVASNFTEWVYYMNHNCWIDKMADRCSCMECYAPPFRTVNSSSTDFLKTDDYSVNQLKNRHCYLCLYEKCNCHNNSKFGKFKIKPFEAGKDAPCLGLCYICRNS